MHFLFFFQVYGRLEKEVLSSLFVKAGATNFTVQNLQRGQHLKRESVGQREGTVEDNKTR